MNYLFGARCFVDIRNRFGFAILAKTISRAIAPVIKVNRPVFSAIGIITWLELKLEALMQPRPHCPQ